MGPDGRQLGLASLSRMESAGLARASRSSADDRERRQIKLLSPRRSDESNPEVPVSISRACLLAAAFSIGMVLGAPSSGYAQEDARVEGAKACGADANRLCKHVLGQGDMVVLKCFKNRSAKLGPSCRTFLTKVGQLK